MAGGREQSAMLVMALRTACAAPGPPAATRREGTEGDARDGVAVQLERKPWTSFCSGEGGAVAVRSKLCMLGWRCTMLESSFLCGWLPNDCTR
eukprot:364493-Chlamydomonas_euryale.AAC.18